MKTKRNLVLIVLTALLCVALFVFGACTPSDSASGGGEKEKSLVSIVVDTMPAKLEYEIGEYVDTTGMKVVAKFSDGSEADVTKDCTTSMDNVKISSTTSSYFVKYVYNKVTKTAKVEIKVNKVELVVTPLTEDYDFKDPWKVAAESEADFVFITSFNSGTLMADGVLELNGTEASGEFTYTNRNDVPTDQKVKYAILKGTYSSSDGVMTLRSASLQSYQTGHLDKATVDTAQIIKDGEEIKGLYFGSMVAANGTVFGWSKTKESAFIESLATNYDYPVSSFYMEIVKNKTIPSDVHLYHADVAGVEIATMPEKTAYEYGEYLSTDGLTLTVNYVAGASRIVDGGFTCDKSESSLTDADTTVTVTYEGKTVTFDITVATPPATGLQSIDVTGAPENAAVIYGKTLAETVASLGITVTANYGDKDPAVVTDYTVKDGEQTVTNELTSFTVSYTEDEVTKEAIVNLTAHYATPYEIAQTSGAEYVFYTYYKVAKPVDGVLELFSDGTFRYTAQMAAKNYNVLSGSYAIEGDTVSFTNTSVVQVLGTSTIVKEGDESATLVKDGEKITALNFGTVSSDNPFWGYGTAGKLVENISTTLGLELTTGYMVLIENGAMGDLSHYW